MTASTFRVLRLALREACLPPALARSPEPTAEMSSAESVAGYHDEGGSSLLPIYHFNALAMNRLAPPGARIVDLGCGTGQFLAYLASYRPDLDLIGVDASEGMVSTGRRQLRRAGLDARVRLLRGDMREFRKLIPPGIGLVSSIFSLHHLTSSDDLLACLREIGSTIAEEKSRLWIFDHVRPRRLRTAEEVPEIFTPDAGPAFREDSRNSLCASWSFDELGKALAGTVPAALLAARSRLLPLYQIHWTPSEKSAELGAWTAGAALPAWARAQARILSRLFRTVPH